MLAIGLLLLTATQYLVAGRFVERQLLEIESSDGFSRLRSLHHAMDQLQDDLASTAVDWAYWDATYDFAAHKRPNYIADNLDASTLKRLRLDFLVIVDRQGRPMFAHSVSGDGRRLTEAPSDVVGMAAREGSLSGYTNPSSELNGLVSTSAGLYMVSSQPVRATDTTLPPGGRLVMGRSVTGFMIPSLRRISGESLEVGAFDTHSADQHQVLRESGTDTLMLHNGSFGGFTPLLDLWGKPIAQLQLRMERPTQIMLLEARRYLFGATLIVGIIFAAAALLLLRSNLLRPIERLAEAVQQIGKDGNAATRLPTFRTKHEFATLADSINGMLQKIEQQQVIQRDRDAAVEANRLKSEFLATMSHEIRTPMNGVLGMCELLQRTDLTSRQKHLSDTILRSARSLLGILNDVLDFSKIESGKLELECAPFSPGELIQTATAPFLANAQTKGLEFSVRIEGGVPPLAMGDELRLRQIMNNLLSNAVKFTEEGSVSVSCAATDLDRDRIELRVTVADTGIGIAHSAQHQIFDPFAQAASDTSRVYGGTGLGLAIVRRLVKLMGGDIRLQSQPGVGSTFTFTAIMRRAVDLPTLRALAEATGPRFSVANAPAILLAEDNAVNREVFTEMLEHFGCRVTAVENGAQAVAAVADRSFDAILMDCQMPVMDGHTATTELRTLERTTSQKPAFIIALTADATPENHQRCIDAGMDAVVTKPISHASLRDVVMRAVRGVAPSTA
ncbi:signal transduction histidine kinase [Povalibacter uvarum]|uniref:histidine kinase n=1 Tax=Povalibacter uvarum TaxID=732238 RepID=A0A841HIM0_9GAMM|nr:CHASE4 domain-containing protein [Povalibacter uvarum]MBB6092656.1 signal transduction histidine kinase [Povalibacter uvarum]